jgi:tetratricopeptide (TPR) repeat protein
MRNAFKRSALTKRSVLTILAALICLVYALQLKAEPLRSTSINWLQHATALEKQADWQGLLKLGQRWTHAEPANATAWFVMGRANTQLQRYAEAINAYQRNLQLAPADVDALNNLGNIHRTRKQYREAMTAYRDAVQIDPAYELAWHNLGLAFFSLKGVPGVTQSLRDLSQTDPDLAEAWRVLAIEYTVSRDSRVANKAINVLRNLNAEQRRRMFERLFASL